MPPITDLEDLVRHLSGRGANRRGSVSPPDDPSGDTAQVLDEIRRRTRALLDPPEDVGHAGAGPPWAGPFAPMATAPRGLRSRGVLTGLALGLLGAALALAADRAWQRLDPRPAAGADREVRQALAEIQARLAAPAAPAPAPGLPSDPTIAHFDQRLDAQFAALQARLDRLDRGQDRSEQPDGPATPRPDHAAADPAIAAIVADLAAIRREQASSEAAMLQQALATRTILEQVNTEVRKVLSRPEPASDATLAPVLALAIQALVHNLQHPSAQVRGEAVEQLARLGPTARTAIPALRDRYARESDHNVRNAIQSALSILTSN